MVDVAILSSLHLSGFCSKIAKGERKNIVMRSVPECELTVTAGLQPHFPAVLKQRSTGGAVEQLK